MPVALIIVKLVNPHFRTFKKRWSGAVSTELLPRIPAKKRVAIVMLVI
jgi:hypothetical protein